MYPHFFEPDDVPHRPSFLHAADETHRLQMLEKEYDTLKENDPAELEKVSRLTQV